MTTYRSSLEAGDGLVAMLERSGIYISIRLSELLKVAKGHNVQSKVWMNVMEVAEMVEMAETLDGAERRDDWISSTYQS